MRSFEMTYSYGKTAATQRECHLPVRRGSDCHSEATLDVGLVEAGEQTVRLKGFKVSVEVLL